MAWRVIFVAVIRKSRVEKCGETFLGWGKYLEKVIGNLAYRKMLLYKNALVTNIEK